MLSQHADICQPSPTDLASSRVLLYKICCIQYSKNNIFKDLKHNNTLSVTVPS